MKKQIKAGAFQPEGLDSVRPAGCGTGRIRKRISGLPEKRSD